MEQQKQNFCEVQASFVKACRKGSVDTVKTMLKSSTINANQVLETGSPPYNWTGLMFASRNLQIETMKVLLEHEADPNFTTNGGFTPIMAVVVASSKELDDSAVSCAKLLKNAGAKTNNFIVFNKRTLLTRAVFRESKALIEYFISTGSDVNIRDAAGETPFNLAVSRNLTSIADTLVKHGANPFLKNKNGDCARTLSLLCETPESADEMLLNIYAWELKYYENNFRKRKLNGFKQMLLAINNERFTTDENNNSLPAIKVCRVEKKNVSTNAMPDKKEPIVLTATEKSSQTQEISLPTTLNKNAPFKLAKKVRNSEKLLPPEDLKIPEALSFHTLTQFHDSRLTPEESPTGNSETESVSYLSLPSPEPSPPLSPNEESVTGDEKDKPSYWILICSVVVLILSLKVCSSGQVKKN